MSTVGSIKRFILGCVCVIGMVSSSCVQSYNGQGGTEVFGTIGGTGNGGGSIRAPRG